MPDPAVAVPSVVRMSLVGSVVMLMLVMVVRAGLVGMGMGTRIRMCTRIRFRGRSGWSTTSSPTTMRSR